MAQIPVQRGELTDRVRRFTGLVGGFSGRVDELLSPVIVAADLNVPPYRLVGQQFFASTGAITPDGSGNCYARLTSGPTSEQVIVLTQWLYSLVGNTTTYSVQVALFREDFNLVAGQPLLVPEQTPREPNGVWHYAEGQIKGEQGAAVPPAAGFANLMGASGVAPYLPFPSGPIVIEPGNALIFQFLNLDASQVYLNIGGNFYPGGIGGEV